MRNSAKYLTILLSIFLSINSCTTNPSSPRPEGSHLTSQDIESANLLDFYVADVYSDTTNFVKFTPSLVCDKSGRKTFYYFSSDIKYKEWIVIYSPSELFESKQWEIKNLLNNKGPIGGSTYCITTKCCYQGACRIVSCYSKCDPDDCCAMYQDWACKTYGWPC